MPAPGYSGMSAYELALQELTRLRPEWDAAAQERALTRAEEVFCSLTRRIRVPKSAAFLWAELAVAMDGAQDGGEVASIKRGDTTIQYSDAKNVATDLERRIRAYNVGVAR